MDYSVLYDFIQSCCDVYGIDESHGLKHSKNCMRWVEQLLENEADVEPDEATMAIYAAALHDMCDKKYTDPLTASRTIRDWLVAQGWSDSMAISLIAIINSMSYSLLKYKAVDGVPVYPNHGKWQRAYHLARHADLLDAYSVGRCMMYTQHIYPHISDDECWKIVEDLFEIRVFRYVTDGWIFLPRAIDIAEELHKDAQYTFAQRVYVY